MTTYAISIDKYEISLGFPRHIKEYDKVVNEGNIKIGNLIALPVSVQKILLMSIRKMRLSTVRRKQRLFFMKKLRDL